MQYASQRRNKRNLYACSLYDRKGNSSTIALMRSLLIYVCPTAFVRKSSVEIANGVTQGGKKRNAGAILPRGNELCELLPLLDAAEINCQIFAFSGCAFFSHFAVHGFSQFLYRHVPHQTLEYRKNFQSNFHMKFNQLTLSR